MKIVAGMGSIDEYISLVEAGADEVFCGFVPYDWNKRYGNVIPLNRREVLYYNIQISSYEDMKILKKMIDIYNVKVSITFNSLYYIKEQYEVIAGYIINLMNIGFNKFIIADIALIVYLRKNGINCIIELSGECSEINSYAVDFFNNFNVSRYIFHRKNSIEDMKKIINNNTVNSEYEAFILNERCHFNGAYCNSLHCDELEHICKLPYKLSKVDNYIESEEKENYLLGKSGCGLCSLYKLRDAKITHLKVVGRGNYLENIVKDILGLKKAINILNTSENEGKFISKIKNNLFSNNCSKECYY